MLARITEQAIVSVAFVDLIIPGVHDPRLERVADRVRAVLLDRLDEARQAGRVRDSVQTEDVMLAVAMVAAVLAKTSPAGRRAVADHSWALLRRALA